MNQPQLISSASHTTSAQAALPAAHGLFHKRWALLPMACALLLAPGLASAADIDGSQLNSLFALPFVGLLLCIALMPLLMGNFWHHHFGKVALFWVVLLLLPFAWQYGSALALNSVTATLLHEYIPFLILILTLYTVSGGIYVRGNLPGSPLINTSLLAIGTALASVMGTTGASMLMIRPLLRANDNRKHRTHVVVFFIFLVSNIGGSLTPLGDPPLFLGFLKGVSFGWTFTHMLKPMLFCTVILLAVFYLLDRYYFAEKDEINPTDPTPISDIRIDGKANFVLLAAVVGLVLLSGLWHPGEVMVLGQPMVIEGLVRDAGLLLIALYSFRKTNPEIHRLNHFQWAPVLEVAKLFFGIFLTMIPVIAMLRAGAQGPLAGLVALTTQDGVAVNHMYFWLTGILSSFLDNAPTYLVFFNLAGGDAQVLMRDAGLTLLAISTGAVFMGANSYIGNAPNFMVKAIAEHRNFPMPSFFGYMVWSGIFLLPLFALLTWVFFL